MTPLTVLSVGYPLAAVSPDSAGGAEQVLATLDRAIVATGQHSIVVAPEGSRISGRLRPIPAQAGLLDDGAKRAAQADARTAIAAVLRAERIDLVHLHGIDFPAYLPPPGVPVLATLHLPTSWYPDDALVPSRPDTWLHCVSPAQQATCPPSPALLPAIENGVPVAGLRASYARRGFALVLGRICPEKGIHLAIDAAEQAGVPLLIAGQVYAYPEHRHYFETKVRPRLGRGCRFIGPVGFARKRRLLTSALCLLVPALVPETSSLVAREAAACGTAVVAFPAGALADTVEHGRTGFLVPDAAGMAAAVPSCAAVDRELCRAVASARFDETAMIDRYLSLYRQLACGA